MKKLLVLVLLLKIKNRTEVELFKKKIKKSVDWKKNSKKWSTFSL